MLQAFSRVQSGVQIRRFLFFNIISSYICGRAKIARHIIDGRNKKIQYRGCGDRLCRSQHRHASRSAQPGTAVDVIEEKVDKINKRIAPIQDDYIDRFFAEKDLDLRATLDGAAAYRNAEFVVIAAPTNYDPHTNCFDTHHIEDVIDLVSSVNPDAVMVIKSTIPVGYCRSLYARYAAKGVKRLNLLFFPEFLRESKALYDNLYPSRIVAGVPKLIGDSRFAEENAAIEAIADLPYLEKSAKVLPLFCSREP